MFVKILLNDSKDGKMSQEALFFKVFLLKLIYDLITFIQEDLNIG